MKVDVRQIEWNQQTQRLIEKLNPIVGVDVIRDHVEKKQIALYEVIAENAPLGVFLVRGEKQVNGENHLVIMHAVAENEINTPMTSVLNPFFDAIARGHNIKSIRVHSDRRGMDKILEKNGYAFRESIFMKNLED